jgi:hypothetical protein
VTPEASDAGQPLSAKRPKKSNTLVLPTDTPQTEGGDDLDDEAFVAAAVELNLDETENQTLLRKLDRRIYWDSFLYHTNLFARDIMVDIYGDKVIDTTYFIVGRAKIMENVKTYKNRTLKRFEVCFISQADFNQSLPLIVPLSHFLGRRARNIIITAKSSSPSSPNDLAKLKAASTSDEETS